MLFNLLQLSVAVKCAYEILQLVSKTQVSHSCTMTQSDCLVWENYIGLSDLDEWRSALKCFS